MTKSELIDKWQKEYLYHIKLANDVGLEKHTRVQLNNYASGIRDVLKDIKNLNGATVKRELLIDLLQWFFDNETKIDGDPETEGFVEIYLNQLND